MFIKISLNDFHNSFEKNKHIADDNNNNNILQMMSARLPRRRRGEGGVF